MSANKGKFSNETVGSDYWISHTDVMTGLLLIFIILIVSLVLYLWIAVQQMDQSVKENLSLEAEKAALESEKTALEAVKKALEAEKKVLEFDKQILEAEKAVLESEKDKREQEKQHILKEVDAVIVRHQRNVWDIMEMIKQQLDKAHVQVDIDYKKYVIHINNSTLGFEKGKFNIEQAKYKNNVAKIFKAFFSALTTVPYEKLQSIETIFIEGHTDADPYLNPQMKGN